ncbi:MAG: hypothetical protein D6690_14685 [Nitrospirae bacterium]|nr:MAG: hypothetical protein D6690_14685 [Nitrospirota bacterium]
MKHAFSDIRTLSDRPPRWYDQYGVPRYCEPEPAHCPDIYADQVAFFTISCQGCTQTFLVQLSWNRSALVTELLRVAQFLNFSLEKLDMEQLAVAIDRTGFVSAISQRDSHARLPAVSYYGDPPVHKNHDGICPGSTMTSEFVGLDRLYAKNALGVWVQRYPYPG